MLIINMVTRSHGLFVTTASRGGTPLNGVWFAPFFPQLHVQTTLSAFCMLELLTMMLCDWLEPCAGISSDEGLLGPGRGGGAGMCDKGGVLSSGSPADSAGNSIGRQGGLQSNLNGMVLRNFQTTPEAHVELSL